MQVLTGQVCDKPRATVQDQEVIFILTEDNYLLPVVYREERKIVICFRREVLRQDNPVPVLLEVPTSLCLYRLGRYSSEEHEGGCYLTCSNIEK